MADWTSPRFTAPISRLSTLPTISMAAQVLLASPVPPLPDTSSKAACRACPSTRPCCPMGKGTSRSMISPHLLSVRGCAPGICGGGDGGDDRSPCEGADAGVVADIAGSEAAIGGGVGGGPSSSVSTGGATPPPIDIAPPSGTAPPWRPASSQSPPPTDAAAPRTSYSSH